MAKYVKTEEGYKSKDELGLATVEDVELVRFEISTAQTTADNAKATADSKMSATNPVGTGSFSMGRKNGSLIGSSSHAEGRETTASGYYSHAEGYITEATGPSSHAEGYSTTASGQHSHAEGQDTMAFGDDSHAEGLGTTASASSSHAEGYNTTASGVYSHAEGYNTTASGVYSHAEGLYTTASGSESHVQGTFNIEDSSSLYAHIVGNGTSDTARSNAHTLDWNGVPWFQGRPQFGGTAQDNGSQTVMANGDKEIIIASSTQDSTKKFKITIDDSGTLTATEVV